MDKRDHQLQTELLETILEYIEGNKTFNSVLAIGTTSYNKTKDLKNKNIIEVISQLNDMEQQVSNGYKFTEDEINEKFTDMLEKLTN